METSEDFLRTGFFKPFPREETGSVGVGDTADGVVWTPFCQRLLRFSEVVERWPAVESVEAWGCLETRLLFLLLPFGTTGDAMLVTIELEEVLHVDINKTDVEVEFCCAKLFFFFPFSFSFPFSFDFTSFLGLPSSFVSCGLGTGFFFLAFASVSVMVEEETDFFLVFLLLVRGELALVIGEPTEAGIPCGASLPPSPPSSCSRCCIATPRAECTETENISTEVFDSIPREDRNEDWGTAPELKGRSLWPSPGFLVSFCFFFLTVFVLSVLTDSLVTVLCRRSLVVLFFCSESKLADSPKDIEDSREVTVLVVPGSTVGVSDRRGEVLLAGRAFRFVGEDTPRVGVATVFCGSSDTTVLRVLIGRSDFFLASPPPPPALPTGVGRAEIKLFWDFAPNDVLREEEVEGRII